MSGKNSIQVGIKVRPLLRKEKDQPWRIVDNSIQLQDSQTEPYCFDHIFDQEATNQIIFDKMAKQIVHSAVKGFNGTIFAYGQTSSGKTYTMMGDNDNPGVMVLAAKEIFQQITNTSDRQFLLRVGYIEIYNEKIYDLLNKKNQDLKIHETPTGIVSVNCEEIIIQCEDDLLNYLTQGSKERTVGETNMNERSSRSHAIFRIIIESRKIDRIDGDDAIIQSVLNLVDLAGSERADQTGARGTRLKEGGHINKSLLFLSNVIKRLSENEDAGKYVSFRDSKLTRILQASLGGNALTSIICTIKPNAIEETQSTLNFALRAKSVKNKPQVNEIISDATMMKRLEKEIKILKSRLAEEQLKNQNQSQIKVRQLEQRIKMEDLKIISCNSLHSMRNRENRRRTWCPSSTNLDVSGIGQQPSSLPMPTLTAQHPSRLQPPKKSYYNTPLITLRPTEPPPAVPTSFGLPIPENLPEIDEEFAPAELVNFDILSPVTSPKFKYSITPKVITEKKITLEQVENDLLELRSYTDLENKQQVIHDSELALRQQVEAISQRNRLLEMERLEYLKLKDDFVVNSNNLIEFQKRCDELQVHLSKLTNSNKIANEKIAKYEAELSELKKSNEKLEMENREAVNLDFEFQRHKNKSKLRENELLGALNEKEKEITKLEKSLTSITHEKFQNSKNELLQLSLKEVAINNTEGEVCIKCEDLQRLLEENKKVTLEFEKLTLEYEKLKLSYTEISNDNENNKLKLQQLEELQKAEKLECERLQLDVQNLRDKLQSVQLQYEQLSTENSSKQAECMTLNRQVEVAREEMVVLEDKFTKLELSWLEQQKLIKDIESQYANIQTKYNHLQNQYEELETNKGQSQTDCQRLEKENVELQTEIEDLKKKVKDAQQKLLEAVEKSEESTKQQNAAKDEKTAETTKLQQDNDNLKQQLLEIQIQFEDIQKEYDDLSNQLMDNLQESEYLKQENSKLEDKLKNYEDNKADVCKAEAEINELKAQLEKVLTTDSKSLLKTPSPGRNSSMRSSGVCVEEEEEYYDEDENLFKKFSELAESFIEIELEHSKGKTKVFKSATKNSTPNNYKLYLKNLQGVSKTQKNFQMEIENIHLQGSFKHHSFHIVELSTEDNSSALEMECDVNYTNGCDNIQDYVEKLKQENEELYKMNKQEREKNQSLLESTERDFREMKEQIQQLSAALSNNQQTIEILEKEKADITLVCEELQEKVNCTLNGSFNSLMNITASVVGTDLNKFATEDKLKELESWKMRESELMENYDSQIKMLEDLTQRNLDVESELQAAQEQLEIQERKNNQLQLEMIEKLELSANEYRDNMKKYNKEWEESRETYEQTIQELNKQLETLKSQIENKQEEKTEEIATTVEKENSKEIEMESNFEISKQSESSETLNIKEEIVYQEYQEPEKLDLNTPRKIDNLKEEQLKLEAVKQSLETRVHTLEEQLENLQQESHIQLFNLKEELNNLKDENHTHCEEKRLLDSKLISLEENLKDAQELNKTMKAENRSLETLVSDMKNRLSSLKSLEEEKLSLMRELEKLQKDNQTLQEFLETIKEKVPMNDQENETLKLENSSLKEYTEKLNSKTNEIQLEINQELEEISTLTTHMELEKPELHQQLEKLSTKLSDLPPENSKLKQEFENHSTSNNEFVLEKSKLQEEIEQLTLKTNELELEKSKLQQEFEKYTISNKEYKETLQEKETMYKQENEILRLENYSLKEIIETSNSKTNELELEISELKQEFDKIATLTTEMELEKSELKQQLKEIFTKLSNLQLENSELKQELENHSTSKNQFLLEKSKLQEEIEKLSTKTNELELKKSELQQKLEKLTISTKNYDETFQEKESMYEQEKTILKLENSSLKESIEKLNSKTSELELEITELNQDLKKIETLTTEMELEKSELKQESEKLSTKLSNLQLENSEIKQELETHSTSKTEFVLEKSKLQEEIEKLSTKTNELELEKSELQQKLEKLTISIKDYDDTLQEKESIYEQEKKILKLENSSLKENIEKLNSKTNELELEILELNQELKKIETLITEMELEKSQLKQELEKLSTKFSNLKLENSELKQELETHSTSKTEFVLEKSKLQEEIEKLSTKTNELELEKYELQQELEKLTISTEDYKLEKSQLGEKLQQINEAHELLKTDHKKLETQLRELSEEKKTFLEQTSILTKAKLVLEERLKCFKENEKSEESLEQMLKENSELAQNLLLTNEKLQKTQHLLNEMEKEISFCKQEKHNLHYDLQTLQEEVEKVKENASKEKRELHHSLQTLQEEVEKVKENASKEKHELHLSLQSIHDSLSKTIQEKHEQLEETETEKEKTKQENCQLQHEIETLKAKLAQTNQNQQQKKEELDSLQQNLQLLKDNLSKSLEEKQQELSNLENNYKIAKQQNSELQNELHTLKDFLTKHNEDKQQQLIVNGDLQKDLKVVKESLDKLNEEKLKLQEKLQHYQHLQEDKCKLEATINALKSAQSGAVNMIYKERDSLRLSLQQYEEENKQYKEKHETLQHKLESLSQQLHESRSKAKAYEELLQEHEEVEESLINATETNKNLQQQITELNTQTQDYLSTIENQSMRLENLHLELNKHKQVEQLLQTKLNNLKETLEKEKSSLQRNCQDYKSSLEELQLKYNSLLTANNQLEEFNQQLKKQLHEALQNLNKSKFLQDELEVSKVKYVELQNEMKDTVEEAGRYSQSLRKDLEHHKHLLEKQLQIYNSLRSETDTKVRLLKQENEQLRNNISTLQSEKQSLGEKLREITVRNFEQDLQRQTTTDAGLATSNTSMESNTSFSPRGRRSLERLGVAAGIEMKAANLSIEEKLIAMQQKNSTTAERKNRRLSTHDERRRQSFWGVSHDKETMTDPVDTNCNCIEMDRKLKECERNLFIKSSQVTALSMELKNHPLKDENAALMKRLQEEQDKSRIEIKRCKQKLYEQTAKTEKALAAAAHAQALSTHAAANAAAAADLAAISSPAIPKVVVDAEAQTDCDLNVCLNKLQGKYNDLKNICRYRLSVIQDLEQKVTEKENSDTNSGLSAFEATQLRDLNNKNESLKNELETVKDKYEKAKLLLTTRRDEIMKLRAQLVQTQQ